MFITLTTGGGRLVRDRPVGREGVVGRERQDHPRGGEAHQGRFSAAKRFLGLRQVLNPRPLFRGRNEA